MSVFFTHRHSMHRQESGLFCQFNALKGDLMPRKGMVQKLLKYCSSALKRWKFECHGRSKTRFSGNSVIFSAELPSHKS